MFKNCCVCATYVAQGQPFTADDRLLRVRRGYRHQRMRVCVLAARCARVCAGSGALANRGRRECRVPDAPAARVRSVGSTRSSPQVHRKSPGIPCAMVLTAYGGLSPATNSCCHRRPADRWRAEPGWADLASASLGISNGCQDHTLWPYAATSPTLRPAMCCLPKFWRRR
jgi:hypothetical protein